MTHEERARKWLVANGYTDLDDDPTPHQVCRLAAEFAAVERETRADADSCLAGISEFLVDAGAEMSTTPPMFYPEAIAGLLRETRREALTAAATICGDHICEWDACGCGDLCREIESLRDGKDQPSESSGGSRKGL